MYGAPIRDSVKLPMKPPTKAPIDMHPIYGAPIRDPIKPPSSPERAGFEKVIQDALRAVDVGHVRGAAAGDVRSIVRELQELLKGF